MKRSTTTTRILWALVATFAAGIVGGYTYTKVVETARARQHAEACQQQGADPNGCCRAPKGLTCRIAALTEAR